MMVGATRLPGLEQAAQDMPFDQFGRYHMLREAVDACRALIGQDRLRILDVGGFYDDHGTPTLPLARFLPNDDLVVLDVVPCDLPGYVQGDGTALHFDDASFDLVVSADTLEHIGRPQRAQFWRELLRVARHGVILLAPFDTPGVAAAEDLLFHYIKVELHAEHQQLKEHRDYGLPELDHWLRFLADEGIAARAYPTGYLQAWLGMMLLKHLLLRIAPGNEAQTRVDSYYNHYFFATERRNPAYRHLVIAPKTPGVLDAVDAVIAPTLLPDVDDASRDWGAALTPTMLALLQRQLAALRQQGTGVVSEQEHAPEQIHALLAAQHDAAQARAEAAAVQSQAAMDAQRHETLLQEQREQVQAYRQQVSMLERILADGQLAQNRANEQAHAAQAQLAHAQVHVHALAAQYEAALRDLTERAAWLERQAHAARSELEAVQRGRLVRLVNGIAGRIKS